MHGSQPTLIGVCLPHGVDTCLCGHAVSFQTKADFFGPSSNRMEGGMTPVQYADLERMRTPSSTLHNNREHAMAL